MTLLCGWRGNVLIGHVGGGVARIGKTRALDTIESGPVFGSHACAAAAARHGDRKVIAVDVGGTTAKASAVEDGRVLITTEGHEDAILIGRGAQWADGTRISERRNLAAQRKPTPLVERNMIVGVAERIDSAGAILRLGGVGPRLKARQQRGYCQDRWQDGSGELGGLCASRQVGARRSAGA
jgi:N-methylhydantoinase A/oxoprolinase/acetone carboxylase beta subunit